MEPTEGARTFSVSGDAYDGFMGRYSRQLAVRFADAAGVEPGVDALDVGCGPGALTAELVRRLGAAAVCAFDPSPPFVEACAARFPDVVVRQGRAEEIPFPDGRFDRVLAQLVLHFVLDPAQAAAEVRRVLRPGGVAGACSWELSRDATGMEMLRRFWDAASTLHADAPDEADASPFGGEHAMAELWEAAGFDDVEETTLEVRCTYRNFDELWSGFMAGIGPAGAFCVGLAEADRVALRDEMFRGLGGPQGAFDLGATARCATGRLPG